MFKNLKRRLSNSKPVMKRQGPTPSKRKYLSDGEKKTPGKMETKKKDVLANDGLADGQDDGDKITTLGIYLLFIYLHQYGTFVDRYANIQIIFTQLLRSAVLWLVC